jgi:hypothetical protein
MGSAAAGRTPIRVPNTDERMSLSSHRLTCRPRYRPTRDEASKRTDALVQPHDAGNVLSETTGLTGLTSRDEAIQLPSFRKKMDCFASLQGREKHP